MKHPPWELSLETLHVGTGIYHVLRVYCRSHQVTTNDRPTSAEKTINIPSEMYHYLNFRAGTHANLGRQECHSVFRMCAHSSVISNCCPSTSEV